MTIKINKLLILAVLLVFNVYGFTQKIQNTEDNINEPRKADDGKLKRFEIGGQFTSLYQQSVPKDSLLLKAPLFNNRPIFAIPEDNHQTEFGVGGRFTYNLNKNIAIEAEANIFPSDRLDRLGKERERIFGTPESIRYYHEPQGKKFQFNAGPKIGYRGSKFGVFGKVRPGMIYVGRYPVTEVLILPTPSQPDRFGVAGGDRKEKFFSVDVGGVFEYYPSKRTILRFDIGDTIINYRSLKPKDINPGFTKHTLQTSIGFGFRF